MVRNQWPLHLAPILCFVAACSSGTSGGPAGSGGAAGVGVPDAAAPPQVASEDAAGQGQTAPASAEASPPELDSETAGTGAMDSPSGPAADVNAPDEASAPDKASPPDDGGTGADVTLGQYSLTLNATKPYMLGSEHLGKTVYGTVVDTTAGAAMARVGPILSTPVTAGEQVKWVWPAILVAGHTYVLGMFSDDAKNMTCVPNTDAGWIFQIAPAPGGSTKAVPVTGDVVIPWTTPVPRSDATKCQYFPSGPIADATAVAPP